SPMRRRRRTTSAGSRCATTTATWRASSAACAITGANSSASPTACRRRVCTTTVTETFAATPDLLKWDPLTPEQVRELLRDLTVRWWIAGGWALDLFLGR